MRNRKTHILRKDCKDLSISFDGKYTVIIYVSESHPHPYQVLMINGEWEIHWQHKNRLRLISKKQNKKWPRKLLRKRLSIIAAKIA
jgi:hypothetical protein